jgi:two-component system response regulator HydG
VQAFLRVIQGNQIGESIELDPGRVCRMGRGVDCDIVLADPLCSRVHAVVFYDSEGWKVRDEDSRNGTFLDRNRIDEAILDDGSIIRVGSSEFEFLRSQDRPTSGSGPEVGLTQTLVRDTRIDPSDTGSFLMDSVRESSAGRDLLDLYGLSVRLLSCTDPDEVARIGLDVLQARTNASVVGYLWKNDAGQLKPKLVLPEGGATGVYLSETLTRLVSRDGHAIWIANQQGEKATESLRHYADAICVPLVSQREILGAIHVYLEKGRFRQSDFDFAISLANIVVIALVRARRQTSLETNYQQLLSQSPGYDEIVGTSPAIMELKQKIARLAKATGCVLVRGESGSGKELVARAIHRASPRADRPMLSVNCAAIPVELMESQLFGHVAGAFTSADRDHTGLFQQADAGTLFLDEVGELTLEGQAKLLRILEGHPFLPVGGTKQIHVDVRVIAATNQDLQNYVRAKKFREDLYYRLSVFELHVPPLRERGGDIELLIDFFFDHFRKQHGRPGLRLSAAARKKLDSYQWPGNVRQLRNVMDSTVVLADGPEITAGELDLRGVATDDEFETLRIDQWERRLIRQALDRSRGSVPDAARLLGIGRATLYRKLDEYGIPRQSDGSDG